MLLTVFSLGAQQTKQARAVRPGVAAAGVKRDISTMKPIAVFPLEGSPGWQVVTPDGVWVSNGPKNALYKLDVKTNKVAATVDIGKRPCAGLAAGFGSLWVPNCTDNALLRVDLKTNQVSATIPLGSADSAGELAAGSDSIWVLTDPKGILARIDPETNHLVAEIQVPSGSSVCVIGEDGAVWVTSTDHSTVVRVDPKTNLITDRVAVGAQPRFTVAGGGAIWTLNQGDGTVSRIDVRTKKLVTNIDVGAPGGGGEIAYGEGFVWVSVFDLPLTQIDPDTNKVIKQWTGPGGDAVRVGHGSVWLSNLKEKNVWRIDPKQ